MMVRIGAQYFSKESLNDLCLRQHFLDGAWVLLYWYLQSPIQILSNEGSYNLRRILVQKLYPILET